MDSVAQVKVCEDRIPIGVLQSIVLAGLLSSLICQSIDADARLSIFHQRTFTGAADRLAVELETEPLALPVDGLVRLFRFL